METSFKERIVGLTTMNEASGGGKHERLGGTYVCCFRQVVSRKFPGFCHLGGGENHQDADLGHFSWPKR